MPKVNNPSIGPPHIPCILSEACYNKAWERLQIAGHSQLKIECLHVIILDSEFPLYSNELTPGKNVQNCRPSDCLNLLDQRNSSFHFTVAYNFLADSVNKIRVLKFSPNEYQCKEENSLLRNSNCFCQHINFQRYALSLKAMKNKYILFL